MLTALALLATLAPPPDLVAVGVVVSSAPGRSVAMLRAGGRTRLLSPGETAWGGRVNAVSADAVQMEFGGDRVLLRLSAEPGAMGTTSPAAPAVTAAEAAPAPAASNERSFERKDVERRIGEQLPRLLAETSLLPAVQDGRTVGFTLTRIPDGTILADAGLLPGDVITRVNDVGIDSMATLVGLWPRLQNETTVNALVLRNGQPLTLTVHLR